MTNPPARLYVAVRADLPPGLQMAQSVHAAFHFARDWPAITEEWTTSSNFLVIVAVPDEEALAEVVARAHEKGIAKTLVREPDLDNELTAVALGPGDDARRLCATMPLALREAAMT